MNREYRPDPISMLMHMTGLTFPQAVEVVHEIVKMIEARKPGPDRLQPGMN